MAADPQTAALQEVVRALNLPEPSYAKARAACGAATAVLQDAYKHAGSLPGKAKASLLGLTVHAQTARRDLDAVNAELGRQYKRLTGPDRAAVPRQLWPDVRKAIINAYLQSFTVRAVAAADAGVSFGAELARLKENLAAAPDVLKAAARAVGKGVGIVTSAAGEVVGGAATGLLKGLAPVLIVVIILLVLAGRTSAGRAAGRAALSRAGV